MPKFIIRWDVGYGPEYDIVEATDKAQAEKMAEEAWKQDVEARADWSAEEYSKGLAEGYGLEDSDQDQDQDEEETDHDASA